VLPTLEGDSLEGEFARTNFVLANFVKTNLMCLVTPPRATPQSDNITAAKMVTVRRVKATLAVYIQPKTNQFSAVRRNDCP